MLGFALPQFGESAYDDLARFAAAAEQLGADSLWVGDRLLAAVHPSVGYGGGEEIPEQFRSSLDPLVALTVAATATSRVRLGASVLVAPWYPATQLARQLTGIDVISRGRLLPGFGIGWSPEEYQAARAPFARRGAQLDEALDALDALWMTDPVEFRGDGWSIPSSWVTLKPVQKPRPPVYLGAVRPPGLRRVGRRADGWLPVVRVPTMSADVMVSMLDAQRRAVDDAARAAGRDPAAIHTYVRVNVAAGTPVDKVADVLSLLSDNGYPDAFVDLLYVATGIDAHLQWVQRLVAR
ncbi:LLM class F420-dependent oxidoreductase [Mycobacterium sp. ACS1612]|uniref:TIGR03619 family F420-dependent LLM class oxidoreductase n=1 Tax=Mycobacterium sp. ACS1612 TaxID=1834117 RepID=UPI000801CCF0|nr:TIGR03619 family F420-dependent LLM class oxidoreductase [Mycobacterium sp. ACS1612]OBF35823.1 LLM class F420-dependent oxidoreductase [Mycobacterium sp. ACS1612]